MIGAKFAAQVLVAVSGWLPGDPNGAPPPTPGVQEPAVDSLQQKVESLRRRLEEFDRRMKERDQRTEETLRELKAVRIKNDAIALQLHEYVLKRSQDALAGIQATLKALDFVGPPTPAELTRIKRLKAEEAALLERIKLHEAELLKLRPKP